MQHNHISTQFDAQLEQVRSKVLHMGGAVEDQSSLAVRALHSGDMFLIEQVLEVEHQVNALEMELDELCTNIIARRTPTAIDLRVLTMVVKTITDLERVGDEAKKIVLMAREFFRSGRRHMPRYSEIRSMSAIAIDMLRQALERVGDPTKNISEFVVYMIKGKDVRHLSADEI